MTHEEVESLLGPDRLLASYDSIPAEKRLHPSRHLCRLLAVASMMKAPEKFSVHAEHDIIYLCEIGELREDLTSDDIIYLARCGVFYDSECACLACFT